VTPRSADAPQPHNRPTLSGRGPLAEAVAAAVDQVPNVRRSGGSGVEVSTQYRGGRVLGVALGDTQVVVHMTALALPLEPLAAAVREAAMGALRSRSDNRDVSVVVDDLDVNRLPRRRT
jgi:hypothetical protein